MKLKIMHRGKELILPEPVHYDTSVQALRAIVASAVNADVEKTRLLCAGKILGKERDESILHEAMEEGATVVVLASSVSSIAAVKSKRSDTALQSMQINDSSAMTELKARAPQFVATPRRTTHTTSSAVPTLNNEYGFATIEALPEYSDSHRAQAVLQRLATDAGILQIMRERHWRVGALREMRPVGRVGRDPCLMGYNVNHGQEIRLRLRTDDHKGFRSIAQLLTVLAHELAHNVEDGHGIAFKETMRWIERRLANVDWRGVGGRVLADGTSARAISTQHIAAEADNREGATNVRSDGRISGGNNVGVSRLLAEADLARRERQNDVAQTSTDVTSHGKGAKEETNEKEANS